MRRSDADFSRECGPAGEAIVGALLVDVGAVAAPAGLGALEAPLGLAHEGGRAFFPGPMVRSLVKEK